jgi:hypothetical protein
VDVGRLSFSEVIHGRSDDDRESEFWKVSQTLWSEA